MTTVPATRLTDEQRFALALGIPRHPDITVDYETDTSWLHVEHGRDGLPYGWVCEYECGGVVDYTHGNLSDLHRRITTIVTRHDSGSRIELAVCTWALWAAGLVD